MSPIASLILLLLVVAAVVALQIFLAKRPARWPGLLLPAACVVASIVAVFTVTLPYKATANQLVIAAILAFLLCNIPTILLVGLYGYLRRPKPDENGEPEDGGGEEPPR